MTEAAATQREPTLLEREEELGSLEAWIERAIAGEGSLRLIEGPAGAGKTALLAAAQAIGESRGMTRLAARATEIERELPFGAVRQLLEPHLRALPAQRREDLLSGSAAPAALALGIEGSSALGSAGPAAIYGLHWLVAGLAEAGPLLLVLDDAHLADPDSERFLAFVAPRLAELPVLLLVAARSDESRFLTRLAGTASDPAARPMRPAPLSAEACATVAAEAFGRPVAAEFSRACHRASGGNPFYLRALLDELERQGIEPTADGSSEVMSLGPRAVTQVILARISRLPRPAAEIAGAAAVLGDDCDPRLAAQLAEVEPGEAGAAIDRLVAAAILDDSDGLGFVHPIVRNAVYADIGGRRRGDLHRQAFSLLRSQGAAAERLAAHLLVAGPAADPADVPILREAAREATARGAPAAAVAYLRRALASSPAEDAWRELRLELGTAELATDGAAARDRLQELLEETEAGGERLGIVRSLAAAHLSVGAIGSLAEMLHAEIDRAAAVAPDAEPVLEAELVMTLLTGLDGASMREAHERVERVAPTLTGATAAERALLSCLAYSRLCRGLAAEEVVEPAMRRLAAAPASGPEALPTADWMMALGTLQRCGRLGAAEDAARRGLEAARSSGSLYALGGAHWVLGVVAADRGRLRDAASRLETALRAAREFGAVAGVQSSLVSLVAVEVERGELAAARSALASENLERGPIEAVVSPGELLESRARLRLAEGDAEGALADLESVAEYAGVRGDLGPGMTLWRAWSALARRRLGDLDAARSLACEEVERARRFGAARPLGIALVVAGLAAEGGEDLPLLEEAVAVLDGSEFQLDRARALVEHGAAMRRSGARADAREPLRAGLELARSSGARPLAERAFEELQATGVRPRKVLSTGLDSLTPSEGRVARMAADGMSNREIAQELFVSPRTVEFHLRQVFVKLEVSSRTDLAEALAR